MIKHIVCFKLKDNSPAACEQAKEVLMGMKDNVPLLRGVEQLPDKQLVLIVKRVGHG